MKILDVILWVGHKYTDDRGYFSETYKKVDFYIAGARDIFYQENCSVSKKNTIRGLHYQLNPKAQAKLVQCVSGKIQDVVVDLRKDSETYGEHVSVVLSDPTELLYVPIGCAHGFCALEDNTVVMYKVSEYYNKERDRCIYYADPDLKINWMGQDHLVSDKDKNGQSFFKADNNF